MSDKAGDVDEQKAIVDEQAEPITAENQAAQAAVKDYDKESGKGQLSMKVLV